MSGVHDVAEPPPARYAVGPVATRADFLAELRRQMSFPDWCGPNLDALADCLADLSWLPPGPVDLVWADPGALRRADPAGYAALRSVLEDVAAGSAGGEHEFTAYLVWRPHGADRGA